MDVKPIKHYQHPKYPTLQQANEMKLLMDDSLPICYRSKAAIAAVILTMSGVLSSCGASRTDGPPLPMSTELTTTTAITTTAPETSTSIATSKTTTKGTASKKVPKKTTASPTSQINAINEHYALSVLSAGFLKNKNTVSSLENAYHKLLETSLTNNMLSENDSESIMLLEQVLGETFRELLDWMKLDGII